MESAPTENADDALEADGRAELDASLYGLLMQARLLAKAYPESGEYAEIAAGLSALREKTWLSRPPAA